MTSVLSSASEKQRARHDFTSNRNWTSLRFSAQALCTPWPSLFQPVLAQNMSGNRMAVLAGNALLSFNFSRPRQLSNPAGALQTTNIRLDTRLALPQATARDGQHDLVGAAFVPDYSADGSRTLIVAMYDGSVERLHLPKVDSQTPMDHSSRVVRTASYERAPGMKNVHGLASAGHTTVVLGRAGHVAMYRANAPWQSPDTVTLPGIRKGRSYAAYIARDASFVAFGRAHVDNALSVHRIRPEGGIDVVQFDSLPGSGVRKSDAVYAFAPMEPGPTGNPNLLLSGWFDGSARAYDLREPPECGAYLTLRDPWSNEGLFSVAAAGHRVAAGTRRHGMIALFDVRSPKDGWSVYAPGRSESSPVYGLALEESRVFGLTRTRAFAIDVAEGFSAETFPMLHGEAKLQHTVMTYQHSKGR